MLRLSLPASVHPQPHNMLNSCHIASSYYLPHMTSLARLTTTRHSLLPAVLLHQSPKEMSLAEILRDSRPSGPKPAPDLALGPIPQQQGTKISRATDLHCHPVAACGTVRPQAMLPLQVNLNPRHSSHRALGREDTSTEPTIAIQRPLGQQEDMGRTDGEKRRQHMTSETHK